MPQMGGSIREEVEVALHEHRFLVTKLLESLNTASLYVLSHPPSYSHRFSRHNSHVTSPK